VFSHTAFQCSINIPCQYKFYFKFVTLKSKTVSLTCSGANTVKDSPVLIALRGAVQGSKQT